MTKTTDILGYGIVDSQTDIVMDEIAEWILTGDNCKWLACINPHSYAVAKNNPEFKQALKNSDWLIPDGSGIVLASKILGGTIHERISGNDVFDRLHQRLNKVGGSVFFLGSTDETLHKIKERMNVDYPNITVCGLFSPPYKSEFTEEEMNTMVEAINTCSPDVLWIGMTSPKQDIWLYHNYKRLNVRFAAGIGAVFDFYSGRVKRSPRIFQRLGLEWLPRLLQEPRRLWRRMLISAPIFLWDTLKQRLGFAMR